MSRWIGVAGVQNCARGDLRCLGQGQAFQTLDTLGKRSKTPSFQMTIPIFMSEVKKCPLGVPSPEGCLRMEFSCRSLQMWLCLADARHKRTCQKGRPDKKIIFQNVFRRKTIQTNRNINKTPPKNARLEKPTRVTKKQTSGAVTLMKLRRKMYALKWKSTSVKK